MNETSNPADIGYNTMSDRNLETDETDEPITPNTNYIPNGVTEHVNMMQKDTRGDTEGEVNLVEGTAAEASVEKDREEQMDANNNEDDKSSGQKRQAKEAFYEEKKLVPPTKRSVPQPPPTSEFQTSPPPTPATPAPLPRSPTA
eukprot:GFUD01135268.1.p1 GENE.GFUD01135268.1~~GFUD01135268.1.p1  ORF type:complete len:161 (-),score=60.08 GFUD01135268.1:103-534(-)